MPMPPGTWVPHRCSRIAQNGQIHGWESDQQVVRFATLCVLRAALLHQPSHPGSSLVSVMQLQWLLYAIRLGLPAARSSSALFGYVVSYKTCFMQCYTAFVRYILCGELEREPEMVWLTKI
jgi:hypothetical protein